MTEGGYEIHTQLIFDPSVGGDAVTIEARTPICDGLSIERRYRSADDLDPLDVLEQQFSACQELTEEEPVGSVRCGPSRRWSSSPPQT